MKEMTLTERYALIGLNAQDSLHKTVAKTMVLRCISCAVVLDMYLGYNTELDSPIYQDIVKEALHGRIDVSKAALPETLKRASSISGRYRKKLEKAVRDVLEAEHRIEEVPNLLGCDMLYVTAGNDMKEYRSNSKEYIRQTEWCRAELLENDLVSDEAIAMFWLLRESGCIYEFFSAKEIKELFNNVTGLYMGNDLAKMLIPMDIKRAHESLAHKYLVKKKELLSTNFGRGVAQAFPELERSESVFIDVEEWFEKPEKRMCDVLDRLTEKGHYVDIVRSGKVPLLKIDNLLYETIPTAKNCGGNIPIQGVVLRRYIIAE